MTNLSEPASTTGPSFYPPRSVRVYSPFSLLDRANTQKGLVGPQMAGVFVTTSSLTRVYKSVSMGCANGSSLVTVDSILPNTLKHASDRLERGAGWSHN